MGVSRISPGDPCHCTVPTQIWKIEGTGSRELGPTRGRERKRTEDHKKNEPRKRVSESETPPGHLGYLYSEEFRLKVPEISTHRGARGQSAQVSGHTILQLAWGAAHSLPVMGHVRGVCGTLPRFPLSLASLGTRVRGGLCGQVPALGTPSFQSPHPPWGGSYLGSTAVRMSSAGRTL